MMSTTDQRLSHHPVESFSAELDNPEELGLRLGKEPESARMLMSDRPYSYQEQQSPAT
jgi:hypothetical protein